MTQRCVAARAGAFPRQQINPAHIGFRCFRKRRRGGDGFQRPITHAALEEDALYGLQLDGMSFEMLITMLEEYGHTGLYDQTG